MGVDRCPTDMIDIIERSGEPDRLSDRRRAGFEPMRRRIVGDRLKRHRLDHFASAGVGRQVFEPFPLAVKRAYARRPIELVAGDNVKIDIQRLHVDIEMHGAL